MFRVFLLSTVILLATIHTSHSQKEPKAADLVVNDQVIDLNSAKYQQLFQELVNKHNFKHETLLHLFQGVRINRKVLILMDRQWESKPYYKYWPLFITPSNIARGEEKLSQHRLLFDRIEEKFGVDREIIVAIWAIESRFGTNMGEFSLFQSLNTLFAAYPRRSEFFRKELLHYLQLCRENEIDPLSVKGSYAGAFGQAQFMPSSFNKYGVDFDGDGRVNLISSTEDILASIANYLKKHRWILHEPLFAEIGKELKDDILFKVYKKGRKGRVNYRLVAGIQNRNLIPPQNNGQLSIIGLKKSPLFGGGLRYVAGYPNLHSVTEYNHSNKYAMAVAEMAVAFKK